MSRTEYVTCDRPGCEASTNAREWGEQDWLRVNVQRPGRKFWADLCSDECAASFFLRRGRGIEGLTEEE